jgi:membrane protease YdiL (CAAX protease family)
MSTTDRHTTVLADVEQHSLAQSTLLHLLPGVLILVFFVITAPLVKRMGAPAMLAFLLAITFVLIPFQLGYLLYQGKKRNGRFSLEGIVIYRERMPAWQYVALGLPCLVWLFVIPFVVFPPIDNYVIEKFFSWLPNWLFFMTEFTENLGQYSRSSLLLVGILQLVVGAVPGPLVEELYYRGYLLPRISRLGKWAPLINTVLFSLYHFTSLWQNPSRIMAFLPLVYAVWWKKNVYLGIIVHCALIVFNSLGILALFFAPA